MVKRRGKDCVMWGKRDERKRTSAEASKSGSLQCSRKSAAATCLLATRCRVCRRLGSHLGSCVELGNLDDNATGNGTSGYNRKAESTDASARGGWPGRTGPNECA